VSLGSQNEPNRVSQLGLLPAALAFSGFNARTCNAQT
jgi:hypothetical protein